MSNVAMLSRPIIPMVPSYPIMEMYKQMGYYPKEFDDVIVVYMDEKHSQIFMVVKLVHTKHRVSHSDVFGYIEDLEDRFDKGMYYIVSRAGYEDFNVDVSQYNTYLTTWEEMFELVDKICQGDNDPEVHLLPHNKVAYKKIQNSWRTSKRVAISHATGTGKSYIILKALYDHRHKKCLVLAPSNIILNRLQAKVDSSHLSSVTFMTYKRAMNLTPKEVKSLQVSLVILDEFHRVGAEKWGQGVQSILKTYPDTYVLGTSATPIRYLDNTRDMAEEIFEGNTASNISLAQAMVRNILPIPIYVSALYTIDEEVETLKNKVLSRSIDGTNELLGCIDEFKKDWELSSNVVTVIQKYVTEHHKKFIVFVESVEHLSHMKELVTSWFLQFRPSHKVNTYEVKYSESDTYNQNQIKSFEESSGSNTIDFLFTIEMLNEGLHVDSVDGVILLRPTTSPIIFYQQIGRALQSTGGHRQPLILDLVNNFKSLRATNFYQDIQKAYDELTNKRKKNGLKNPETRFSIIDEVQSTVDIFISIERNILDHWNCWFEELKKFAETNGHMNVDAKSYLSAWVRIQRSEAARGNVADWKIKKLDSIGFIWKQRENNWNSLIESLKQFKKDNGHCNLPETHPHHSSVKYIRGLYYAGSLSEDKISIFKELGVSFNPDFDRWIIRFEELIQFYKREGHFYPPSNSLLYIWTNRQRKHKASGKLTCDDERTKLLNSIGFTWCNTFEYEFIQNCKTYKQTHGHLNFVPKLDIDIYAIYRRIRKKYWQDRNSLCPDMLEELEKLGISWEHGKRGRKVQQHM